MDRATRRIRSGSHVQAIVTPAGNAVAGPSVDLMPPRAPWPASIMFMAGTPSRGMDCVANPVPPNSESFSSGVRRPKRSSTRASKEAWLSS